MTSQELLAGFKNALDRGSSIEEAKQAFTNAGYPASEIEQASEEITNGAISLLYTENSPYSQQIASGQALISEPPTKSQSRKAVLTTLLITSLLIIIFLIVGIVFKDQILNLFK